MREAVYWGKQSESAILAALGYGGLDVAAEDARWVRDSEAACAVAMVPSSSFLLLPSSLLAFWAFD